MRKRYISIFETAYKASMETEVTNRESAIVNALEVVSSEIEKLMSANMSQKQMEAFPDEVKDFMEYFMDKFFDGDVNEALKAHTEAIGDTPLVFHVYDQLIDIANTQELEAAWAGARRDQKTDIKPFVDTIANAGVERILELYFNGYSDELQLPAGELPPEDKHALETYLFRALKYGAIGLLWKWDEVQEKSILSMFRTDRGKIFACGVADVEEVYYAMRKTGHIDARETPPLFADFDVRNNRKRTGSKNGQGRKNQNSQDGKGEKNREDNRKPGAGAETISGEAEGRQKTRMQILPKDETASGVDDGSTETEKNRRSNSKRKVKFTIVKAGDDSSDDDSDSDGSGGDE